MGPVLMPRQDQTAEKMLNNVADFIAATQAKPDQRAWNQLLIYCPREVLERRFEGEDDAMTKAQEMLALANSQAAMTDNKCSPDSDELLMLADMIGSISGRMSLEDDRVALIMATTQLRRFAGVAQCARTPESELADDRGGK